MIKYRHSNKIPFAQVSVAQVPMIMTFDEDHVEYIGDHLGEAILKAYELYAMFGDLQHQDDQDDGQG